MKREAIDFFVVESHQLEIHDRLLNWARWVRPRHQHWEHPMWKQGRSNARQWHQPVVGEGIDPLDGQRVEKAVSALPVAYRTAIRWCYVKCDSPHKIRRELAVTADGLLKLIRDARQMLLNREA